MDIIQLEDVSKAYRLYDHPGGRLRELLTLNRCRYHTEYWALRDVSVSIRRGETFCIVGENGSGKSTLLQLVAGILQPTSGSVAVGGRVTALLELGSGFNPEYTGRENVFMNGAILGFTRSEMDRKLDSIFSFAAIGDYVDQPVRTYSSGMAVRLAFSVAVHLDPDILIVDEALAVGDIGFRQRCMHRIHELRARGVTIVYVTHDVSDVKTLGHRTMWLDRGRVVEIGDSDAVVQRYLAHLLKKDSDRLRSEIDAAAPLPPSEYREPPVIVTSLESTARRHGDGAAHVLGIEILDENGRRIRSLRTPARITIRVSVRAKEAVRLPIVGFLMRTSSGEDFAGTNTAREDVRMAPLAAGQAVTVDFHVRLPELAAQRFGFTPGIADGTLIEFRLCDLIEDAATLEIEPGDAPVRGYLHIPCVAVRTLIT